MNAMTPGPAVDLIEHAARIIIASRKQPYTAPAHWAGALWEAGMLVAPGSALQVAAPAGDGGLREALEQHAEVWRTTGGPLGVSYATRVRDLIAAHPAAPAVPQPATLPTCVNCESETFQCSACGSLVEPWESAVPQPVDREALYWAISEASERQGVAKFLEEEDIDAFTSAVLAVLAGEQEQVEP